MQRAALLQVLQRRLERADNSQLRLQPREASNPEDLPGSRLLITVNIVLLFADVDRLGVLLRMTSTPRKNLWYFPRRHGGDNLAPEQRADSKQQAPHPLLQCETSCGKRHLAVLNDNHLRGTSANPNGIEDGIGEDAFENIPLTMNLSGVEFIKQCHHDKRIEDNSKVLCWPSADFGTSS